MQRDNQPPAKKRKVDSTAGLSGPDGFSKPTKPVSNTRPVAPDFGLAFDIPKTKKSSAGSLTTNTPNFAPINETRRPPNVQKMIPVTSGIPRFVVGSSSASSSTSNTLKTPRTAKHISASKATPLLDGLDPLLHVTSLETPSKPPSKGKAPLKPLSDASKPSANLRKLAVPPLLVAETPVSKLKTLPPPIPIPSSDSSKPMPKLKALHPPVIPPPETPSKLLKALPPPRLPPQPQSSSKPLKTIGTTRVARATDLLSESGAAELASIFIQHSELLATDPQNEPETQRGLNVSPQKGAGGKGPKFVRDGLAARASAVLSHANTSLTLWTKEYSVKSSYPKPDLRIRILKIIQAPHASSSLTAKSIPGLALCCLSGSSPAPFENKTPQIDHPVAAKFPLNERLSQTVESQHDSQQNMLFPILFSFSAHPASASTPVRNPSDLVEGREFYMWKPWQIHSFLNGEFVESLMHACTSVPVEGKGEEGFELKDDTTGRIFVSEDLERSVLFVDRFVAVRDKGTSVK
ncbi:hypothetical protein VKT23_013255 [Stygiomarasmius scandens]|uniref:Uncharacterized protein n=1 Tax=Marasmiellus scandens TaxID=2682957 RepID=A0ABR1J4F1_9AGAR